MDNTNKLDRKMQEIKEAWSKGKLTWDEMITAMHEEVDDVIWHIRFNYAIDLYTKQKMQELHDNLPNEYSTRDVYMTKGEN
jgi:hypothetical protein